VKAGSIERLLMATSGERRRLAAQLVRRDILPMIDDHPHAVVAIQLRDLPLSFSALPLSVQRPITQDHGDDAARRYETAVARLLDALIGAVHAERPRALMSVVGLPVEPGEPAATGTVLDAARATNERYSVVIDRLGAFVPGRTLIVFGSSLDETKLAQMGMNEALRLRERRPIVFQTNVVWQALINGPDDVETLVARRPQRGLEIEASLLDD